MTDLSTCSTPNETLHKVTVYIYIYKAVYHFQLLLQSDTGGVNLKFYPGKSENSSSRTFSCAHQ